jgi:HPt (histidine-containing phosphotransfer) domain-containing protein
MDGYLTKPIRPKELYDMVDHYIATKDEVSLSIDSTSTARGPIDVAQLLDRLDGDRILIAELVDIFRVDCPGNLRFAQEAIDRQDANGLWRSAHKLKGALANLSAIEASTIAAELEVIGRSLDMATAQATLDSLVQEAGNALLALEALCHAKAQ